jgi:hypothetical protein
MSQFRNTAYSNKFLASKPKKETDTKIVSICDIKAKKIYDQLTLKFAKKPQELNKDLFKFTNLFPDTSNDYSLFPVGIQD